jgi:hypothetical protein
VRRLRRRSPALRSFFAIRARVTQWHVASICLEFRASFSPRLQARTRRNCLEAKRLRLSVWPLADWLKMKNADAPAVKREEQGEWGRDKWRSKVSGRHWGARTRAAALYVSASASRPSAPEHPGAVGPGFEEQLGMRTGKMPMKSRRRSTLQAL